MTFPIQPDYCLVCGQPQLGVHYHESDDDSDENEEEEVKEMARPLYEIAQEIEKDWGRKVNFGARPYLDAMRSLDSINDHYFMDDGRSIVLYFLSNAGTWRGDTAKRVKAELKGMLKK